MRNIYTEIEKRLELVDFEQIWKGFYKCEFALYNSDTVYLKTTEIPWNDRFVGNTAINYQDKYIAIWKITEEEQENLDYEELTANLVHEMFHAFANTCKEERYPNDLKMLMVPDDLKLWLGKYAENKVLAEGMQQKNTQEKYLKQEQKIQEFTKKNLKRVAGDFYICGYDPMNFFRCGDILYCSTYMAVNDSKTMKTYPLFGESMLEMIPGDVNQVRVFYQEK